MRSSLSAFKNAVPTSTIAVALPSLASTTPVRKIDSVITVGDDPSDFSYPSYVRCLLPSATLRALIDPSLFSVRNSSDSRASCLSLRERSFAFKGSYVSIL